MAEEKEVYIRFMAPVNPFTSDKLMKVIDNKFKNGYTKFHLLISSPGGSVFHGMSLYHFLKALPIEVNTYNFGSVDSVAVVLFCAGAKRYSVQNARFLIHGVNYNINGNGNISFDEKQLEEILKSVQVDKLNIAKVISETTHKKLEEIIGIVNERKVLNPGEAKDFGLVTEIKNDIIPRGAELVTIDELDAQPPQGLPR